MEYNSSSLNYDRLERITEKNGNNTKSYNPTVFEYGARIENITVSPKTSSIGLGEINSNNSATIAGDFNGDAKMDFALYTTTPGLNANKDFYVFQDVNNSSQIVPTKVNCGYFGSIFPTNGLTSNGKMYNSQGITITQGDPVVMSSKPILSKTYWEIYKSMNSQGIKIRTQ